jgi:para-nitrobenzyl esterase
LGSIIGVVRNDVSVFLGLPYAAPPTGEYRFAPPREITPWLDPLEAFKPGPMAHQVPIEIFKISVAPDRSFPGYSEDCLNLNIWAPEWAKAGDELPVYFFIHGGGFGLGSDSQFIYDGTALAKEGIVVVTINYRLGAMGFFSSNETMRLYNTTGNWGILDQIQALKWVQNNIAAFGGDPSKVTIGGESAGSFSVSALILSPKAKGLFRGAIMESGTIFSLEAMLFTRGDMDLAIKVSTVLSSIFGANDNAEGLAELRKVDAEKLTRLTPFAFDFTKPSLFGLCPVKDGKVIPLDPMKALIDGASRDVKILMGFNHDEGTLFVPEGNENSDPQIYKDIVSFLMGEKNSEIFWKHFPVDSTHGLVDRTRQAVGYLFMTANMKRFADLHVRQADLYFYQFDYLTEFSKKMRLGAFHASELPFVFGVKVPSFNSTRADQILSDEIRLRWVNFIKNGDPNVGLSPPTKLEWPKYDPQNPEIIVFDNEVTVGPMPDLENLDFMTNVFYGPLPD